LMLIAPFAGAAVARAARRHRALVALAVVLVAAQFAFDLRLRYPADDLPMTALALRLARGGVIDRFDEVYVESRHVDHRHRDEVRVATDFRRPVRTLPADRAAVPWKDTSAERILVLNYGWTPPGAEAGSVFEVSRVQAMTAWGVCNHRSGSDDRVTWLILKVPTSMRPGERAAVGVTLQNAGSRSWRSNECGVSLRHRWVNQQGRIVGAGRPSPLPRAVEPGDTMATDVAVEAPSVEGEYTLELGLERERSGAASMRDGRAVRVRIEAAPLNEVERRGGR